MNPIILQFVIIALLVVILIGVTAVAVVESQIKDKLNGNKNGTAKSPDVDFKKLEDNVEALLRESIPTDGATLSRRVNDITRDITKLVENSIKRDSSDSEARNAVRTAQDRDTRVSTELARQGEKLDALAIALASQGRDTAKVLNYIQTNQPIHRDTNTSNLTNSTAGQVSAGASATQIQTEALEQAQEGLDVAKAGVKTIQKGIDEIKDGTK